MKRKELLENLKSEKDVFNVERIISKDERFLTKQKLILEDSLADVEESIEDYLKNPELNIDDQFLTLLKKKIAIQDHLNIVVIASKYL